MIMKIIAKTVVVTGGSDGLGFSLAKAFIDKGAKVVIIGRDQARLDQAVKLLGKDSRGFVADVTKLSELDSVAKKVGGVDVLINNAGIWLEGSIKDNSEAEISQIIDINFKGVVLTTKAFLPNLLKSEEASIINISSTSGLRGRDNQAVYAATKFAVTGFTESLKVDLAETNIKVCGFYPGGMRTKLFEKAGKPKANQDWMDTDKVAEVIVFMVERDATMMLDQVVLNKRKTSTSN